MFQLRCCGAKSPEDWNSSQWRLKVWSETIEAVPASCCKTNTTSQCGLRIHPSSIAFTVCTPWRLSKNRKTIKSTSRGLDSTTVERARRISYVFFYYSKNRLMKNLTRRKTAITWYLFHTYHSK